MDVGFGRAGFRTVWASELNKHACSTYRANFDASALREGDLLDYLEDLPRPGEIDCIFGGPPCQGFSVAGKMDLADPRSELVRHYMNVVRICEPKFFVMENVKALAVLKKFEPVRQGLIGLAEQYGYEASFHVLNSKDFGVPQSRERMFFIGFRRDMCVKFHASFFEPYKRQSPTLRELFKTIGPAGSLQNPLTCKAKITLAERPVLRKSPYAGMIFNGQGRPLNLDSVSYTLPASMGGNKTPIVDAHCLEHELENWVIGYHGHLMTGNTPLGMNDAAASLRRLTVKEAAFIQTFPSSHLFSGPISSVYAQIGNAVPCELAYAVASAVRDAATGVTNSGFDDTVQLSLC